ncbi:MAG: cyanophycin synthetase [Oligoflexales bacterium]
MRIIDIHGISGPNVFQDKPVVVMMIDLEDLYEIESKDLPGFVDKLLLALPGLHKHRCSRGYEGGFVERLHEGTYIGHVIEHVALELSDPVGLPAYFGKTVFSGTEGIYRIAIESHVEAVSRKLLEAAVDVVDAICNKREFDIDSKISFIRYLAENYNVGPSTQAIIDAAEKNNVPWRRIGDSCLLQLGYGKYRTYVRGTESWNTRSVAVDIVADKNITNDLLTQSFLPSPRGIVVEEATELEDAIQDLRLPVVVKPIDGNHGKGVTLDVRDLNSAIKAFGKAQKVAKKVLIEEMLSGREYRVIIVDGKFVAASEKFPARVVGDGIHTISGLVALENSSPQRGDNHGKPLTKIKLDQDALEHLAIQGVDPSFIPDKGKVINLARVSNLSVGGTSRDVTDFVHPSVKKICERAAEIVGLDVCGVDLVADDISRGFNGSHNGIIELNAAPGIRMHHHPSEGKSRDVASAIIDMLYPNNANGRVPIIAITGTNGKTTTAQMIAHVLRQREMTVGLAATGGIWIGHEIITQGDTTGPRSARTILADPKVDVAVLETARGGIVRYGLGFDWCDIGIITNIRSDHIGQDGIMSIDDLVHVKALVAERVKPFGTLIVNGTDPRLIRLTRETHIRRDNKKVVYFSSDSDSDIMRRHIAAGGTGYFVRRGWVVEADSAAEKIIVPIASLPITLGGHATFQVENVIAAIAACRELNLSRSDIGAALRSFRPEEQNPGRMAIYSVQGGYVVVDYGHNAAAFQAVGAIIKKWSSRTTAIIGVPGDRGDPVIEMAGQEAARGFDRLIIKEDRDLRGRARGEVASLLERGARLIDSDKDCRTVHDEAEALEVAIDEMVEGETVVVFYEDLRSVEEIIHKHGGIIKNLQFVVAGWQPRSEEHSA